MTAVDPSAFISMMRGEEVFPARQIDEALQEVLEQVVARGLLLSPSEEADQTKAVPWHL